MDLSIDIYDHHSLRHDLEEAMIIDDLLHHLQHVIRLVGVIRHHISDNDNHEDDHGDDNDNHEDDDHDDHDNHDNDDIMMMMVMMMIVMMMIMIIMMMMI